MPKVFSPVPLERKHPRKDFDCSDEVLNDWLARYSVQADKKGASKSYASLDESGNIAGFYSLVFGQITHEEASDEVGKGMPRHPIPVLIIARLAVDHRFQGIGLGRSLLKDAVIRALSAAEIGGLRAIVVHAKHEKAAAFYDRFGFLASKEDPLLLMLPIKDAVEAF